MGTQTKSKLLQDTERIVILTGAGLSAESGLSTFRDKHGIWARHRIEDVATPEAFSRNPDAVHDFYNHRRAGVLDVQPNAAHLALARLEAEHPGTVLTVTQNIDPLHERAGSRNLIHIHGELLRSLCAHCAARADCGFDLSIEMPCGSCKMAGGLRPDVVWFGEMPYRMDDVYAALATCDLFVSIGTSCNVYPAADFVTEARAAGAHTLELNLEPSDRASLFGETRYGPATQVVPAFVDEQLARTR
jgi:NAD-dependent deacetylase